MIAARTIRSIAIATLLGCGEQTTAPVEPGPELTAPVPLGEMGNATWKGFSGGHYPGGEEMPAAHQAEAVRRAKAIGPLSTAGDPDPAGRYALLSIGMSNTTQEFCSGPPTGCASASFVGQALADPGGLRPGLVLVDGAAGGQTAPTYDDPLDANYDRIRDTRLAALGLTERQVRAVWLKVANARPTLSLADPAADAFQLLASMGGIARALRIRYPSLEMIFLSNRIYGGYATTTLNPEPYAFESGFAAKWLVEAQIRQMAGEGPDPVAGNLAYGGPGEAAPWIGWGPDLWAAGATPRADGLVWLRSDFQNDGTHPSAGGVRKVGTLLLEFFTRSPVAACWFAAGGGC